jgi:L-ascorbate metabolism protein UlaG (beta-lactamase superfamily)
MGGRATGARADRILRSPQFRDGVFHNADRTAPGPNGRTMVDEFRNRQDRKLPRPVPLVTPDFSTVTDRLNAIWLGHSTALVEIEGHRVLVDPVWSERCSPTQLGGPKRLHPMPVPLSGLPALDAVVISHDHYDHLDLASIRQLARTQPVPFLVPLGVGAHLERWGVPPDRIIELDWHEDATVAGLRFVATPAHHFSGRRFTRNDTLWASWVILGKQHKVFYTGDGGYFPGFARIGDSYGPFDLTLVQTGAYSKAWPDIHMTPEQALDAHLDARGGVLLPVHWGTFTLAFHSWADPIERLQIAAEDHHVRLVVPKPGQRVDLADIPATDPWWQGSTRLTTL